MTPFWIALFPFVLFFAWLVAFGMRKRCCPDCGEGLSPLQSPFTKTRRQWLEGGLLCGNCGCETDTAGNAVSAETWPKTRRLMASAVLAAFLLILAIEMLAMLVQG